MSCNDIVIMVLLWIHKLPAVEEFILHLVLPHVREGEVRGPPWNIIPRLLLAGEGGGGSIKEEERGGRGGGGGGREGRRKERVEGRKRRRGVEEYSGTLEDSSELQLFQAPPPLQWGWELGQRMRCVVLWSIKKI